MHSGQCEHDRVSAACGLASIPALQSFRAASVRRHIRSRRAAGTSRSTARYQYPAGPPTARVRLADFLATGRLGPVHCGLSRNIALMLGPPDMWVGATIDEQVMREGGMAGGRRAEFPLLGHGKLELSARPSGRMRRFSSRSVCGQSPGDCEVIAGNGVLERGDERRLAPGFLRVMSDGASCCTSSIHGHRIPGHSSCRSSAVRSSSYSISNFRTKSSPTLAALDGPHIETMRPVCAAR